MFYRLVFIFLCIFVLTKGSNILGIFYWPSQSHHILGEALLKGLAKRGHNVTMVTPFPMKEMVTNYTNIDIPELLKFKEGFVQNMYQGKMSKLEKITHLRKFQQIFDIILGSNQLQNLLKSESKFDAIISFLVFSEALFGIADHFDAPVIGFVPLGGLAAADILLGNPAPYSFVPNALSGYTDNMTFIQRVTNTLINVAISITSYLYFMPKQEEYLKKYFPNAAPLEKLLDRLDIVLVNSHVSTETPRPYLPNMIQIGGFHIQEPETLSDDLRQFLDEAEEGVIYFSFGTNVKPSDLPPKTLDAFIKTFEKLPFKVLWKYDDNMAKKPKNIKVANWLPQRGVLAHRNVKAFISHGGMGSTTEALYYGVPLLCIPFFGDQEKNCADAVTYGYAKQTQLNSLTEETLMENIMEILNNAEYKQNVKLRSQLFREQPIKPLDKAIYWVEHVIKHKGAKHLKGQATKVPWYQYLLLDVAAFLFAIFFIIIGIIYYGIKLIMRKIFRRRNKLKSN